MHRRPARARKRNHRVIDPSKIHTIPFHPPPRFHGQISHSTTHFVLSDAQGNRNHPSQANTKWACTSEVQSSELRQFRFRLQNCSSAICVPCVLPSTNLLQKLGREIQLTVYAPELAMGFLHFGSAKFYNTLLKQSVKKRNWWREKRKENGRPSLTHSNPCLWQLNRPNGEARPRCLVITDSGQSFVHRFHLHNTTRSISISRFP